MSIANSLEALGLVLPPVPKSLSSYIPAIRTGNLIFTSGQIPLLDGVLVSPGKVGDSVPLEKAGEAAIICCLNALAAISTLVFLEEIQKIVKMGVYVASTPEWTDQHLVASYPSDLLLKIFGEKGKHSRFAIGVSSLPINACVELELLVEVK
jgi:enamine deaminase RidA (YjgF/YER057c/UK114 family)